MKGIYYLKLQGPATTACTTTPVAAIATTTSSVASMTMITTSIGQPPQRQPPTAVLSRQSLPPNSHTQVPATVVSGSPATTIVTVVPSSKVHVYLTNALLLDLVPIIASLWKQYIFRQYI